MGPEQKEKEPERQPWGPGGMKGVHPHRWRQADREADGREGNRGRQKKEPLVVEPVRLAYREENPFSQRPGKSNRTPLPRMAKRQTSVEAGEQTT